VSTQQPASVEIFCGENIYLKATPTHFVISKHTGETNPVTIEVPLATAAFMVGGMTHWLKLIEEVDMCESKIFCAKD
jgi:hypothetical protein